MLTIIDRSITYFFGASNAERVKNISMLLFIWLAMSAIGLALSGCSTFGGREYAGIKAIAKEGIAGAKADRMEFNDTKADVLLALPCDASVGSVMRLQDARKRAIFIELCGGPKADAFTVDDVATIMKAFQSAPISQPGAVLSPTPLP